MFVGKYGVIYTADEKCIKICFVMVVGQRRKILEEHDIPHAVFEDIRAKNKAMHEAKGSK